MEGIDFFGEADFGSRYYCGNLIHIGEGRDGWIERRGRRGNSVFVCI